jgi:hypothetical protein
VREENDQYTNSSICKTKSHNIFFKYKKVIAKSGNPKYIIYYKSICIEDSMYKKCI